MKPSDELDASWIEKVTELLVASTTFLFEVRRKARLQWDLAPGTQGLFYQKR
jgi:hypothetical protein